MLRHSFLTACALAVWASGASLSCRAPLPSGKDSQVSIILISIDTLRADRLGAYGSKAGLTPSLDAFAREAVTFEEAYSHVPLTLPAHVSLFTADLPPRHGVRDNMGYTLAGRRTLAAVLKSGGRRTLGAVSSFVLRRGTGIAEGFDEYDDAIPTKTSTALGHQQREGGTTSEALLARIEATSTPLFAFLHIYEPHTPYTPPEKHAHHGSAYDGDVAFADEIVGSFLSRLKALGRYDDSIIVITADHGEGLGDHGESEHGVFVYRESVHVPLLIRLPGGKNGGRRVTSTVRHVDVAPTLLDLAGLPPLSDVDGESLSPLLGGAGSDRLAYSESLYGRLHMGWSDVYAVTEGRHRYIRAPKTEFYDIKSDPGERKNLVAERTALAARMDSWIVAQNGNGRFDQPGVVDKATREKLQALGYLGGSAPVAVKAGESLPDPKDRISSWSVFEKGLALREQGRADEAIRVFKSVLADNPRMADGWETLAQTLFQAGRSAEARQAFDRVLSFDPTRSSSHISIAKMERLSGRLDVARRHAEIAAKQDPGGANEFLAELELAAGRVPEAAAAAARSVQADPSRTMSHYALGVAAVQQGNLIEAEKRFREALARSASDSGRVFANLHASLADVLARLDRLPEAEVEFRKEIELMPASRSGRIGLAMLLRAEGRDAEARSVMGGLIESSPSPTADDYDVVARTLARLGDGEAAAQWARAARARFPKDPRFR